MQISPAVRKEQARGEEREEMNVNGVREGGQDFIFPSYKKFPLFLSPPPPFTGMSA